MKTRFQAMLAALPVLALVAITVALIWHFNRPNIAIINNVQGVDLGTEYMITVPADANWDINDIEEVLNQLSN